LKLIFKISFALLVTFFTFSSFANVDIGFGTIKGYKVGNADKNEITVYLNEGYERDLGECKGAIVIKLSDYGDVRSEKRLDLMMSTILAAYMSNKKVRFYSHKGSCEATFVALQETVF